VSSAVHRNVTAFPEAAAGTPNVNFAISAADLLRATGGVVTDLAQR
jgi:hypothetical protein